MGSQPVHATVNSEKIAERMLQRMSKEQLTTIIEHASRLSGRPVANLSFEPGDDLCPTFHFPIPFPPKFDQFLHDVTALGANTRIFPFGIVAPEGVLVQLRVGQINR